MFNFEPVAIDDRGWDDLVRQYPGETLFHTSFWAEVVEKTYGIKGRLLQIFRDGAPVGVVPVWISRKGGLKLLGSPLRQTATHFCGPLCRPEVNLRDVVEELYSFGTKELGVAYMDITLPQPLTEPFSSVWNVKTPDTFVLELDRTEEELWKSFEGRMRTAVRKAEKNDVEIEIVACGHDEIGEFYSMLEEVHGRHGVKPVFPRLFYENLLIPSTPFALLYGAKFEERWISMALILKFGDWLNYHSAASVRKFANLGGNNLLQWHVIREGIREGKKRYDLGAGSGIAGIEKFKKSMRPSHARYQKMWRADWRGRLARTVYEGALPWLRKMR